MQVIDVDDRKQKAVDNFKAGYNCAQSVFMAYSDVYKLDANLAKTLSSSFGGGIGRLREMCGACSGMFMLVGMQIPVLDPNCKDCKTDNYKAVQTLANRFKDINGSYICADLLKIKREAQQPNPDDRNAEYYAKRPCAKLVADAAFVFGEWLNENK
jgi:C_GCAxxG_C_C family probable redox protein